MAEKIDVAIIGGGVVGSALAYEISALTGKDINEVLVFERNRQPVGDNQSSRSSGVIHAGVYYTPGSNRAKFCVEGNRMLYEFGEANDVPAKAVGKLLVALDSDEDQTLDTYLERALANGVPGIRKITGREVKAFEPNIDAFSALYLPTSGILGAVEYMTRLRAIASGRGAIFRNGSRVTDVRPSGDLFELTIQTPQSTETFEVGCVINSAGLYSDEIARMVNPQSEYVINPIRGEAAKFYKTRRQEIGMSGLNVYPTPYFYDPSTGKRISKQEEDRVADKYPFVGVHLTPTFDSEGNISKTVTIGPFLTPGVGKEDYGNNLKAPDMFFDEVKRFFPGIRLEDIELHQAGILAKLCGNRDFVMERDKNHNMFYNLVGIDSPGLTSSLAIAKHVKKELFD